MMRFPATFFLLVLFTALPAAAQEPGCERGTAEKDLDANNVLARVFNTGSLFFGNATVSGDGYLVPRAAGTSPVFASGLWVGGFIEDSLRVAGATYSDFEFWPGPLDDDGLPIDPEDCSAYDRIYKVSQQDITEYESGGAPSADLAQWPVGLGAPTVDSDGEPVEVASLDQVIDLVAGERPDINGADEAVWWIMNDAGNEHLRTGSEPLGIEVRVLAYAYDRLDGYGNSTFYDYALTYKGAATVEDTYVGFFVDPDLGDAADDYVGSDPVRGLGFAYNEASVDAVYGTPPAVGYDFLSTPEGDGGDPVGTAHVTYFVSSPGGGMSDPRDGQEFYNYLTGRWADGTPLTIGGDGYDPGSTDFTDFAYPGDPPAFWSEFNVDGNGTANTSGDRRFVVSSGPTTLVPGEEQAFTLGILWALGSSNLDSVARLKALSDFVQADFDPNTTDDEGGAVATGFALAEAFPNPFARSTTFSIELAEAGHATVEVFDVLGRRVDVLIDGPMQGGTRTLRWTPEAALPSGVYLVRLRASGASATQTVVLQR